MVEEVAASFIPEGVFNSFESQKLNKRHTKKEKEKRLTQGPKWTKKKTTPKKTQRTDMRGCYHAWAHVGMCAGRHASMHTGVNALLP